MSEGCSAVKRLGESCPKNNNCTYPKCLIDETMIKAREEEFEHYTELAKHIERMASTGRTGTGSEWCAFLSELNGALQSQQETEALQKRVCELEFNLKQLHSRLELLILTERVNINLQETVRDLNIAEQLLKQGN